jgi:hypothetical protein
MNRRRPGITLAFITLLSLGCSDAGAPRLAAPGMGSESKTAGGKPSTDLPIRWEIPYVADGSSKIQGSANALTVSVSPATGTAQAYVFDNGACGVKALLHQNGGGDATVQPNANWSGLKRSVKDACGGSPLAVRFDFPDGSATSSDNQNVWAVDPVDVSRQGVAVFAAGPICGQLRYGSTDLTTRDLPSVQVTQLAPSGEKRIWRVESTADPISGQHLAYCSLSGITYQMPFVLYIYEK